MESFQPRNNNVHESMEFDSEKYVASLEGKLKRLKGLGEHQPTGKGLVHELTQARSREMSALTEKSDQPYISDHITDEDRVIENNTLGGLLQRKLQPEKQALTTEELMDLVENDQLAKVVADLQAQEDNKINSELVSRLESEDHQIDQS